MNTTKYVTRCQTRSVYLVDRTDKLDEGTDLYVGSPGGRLSTQFKQHKYVATHENACGYNDRLYIRMREVGVDKWSVTSLLTHV